MILADHQIKALCEKPERAMIFPFVPCQVRYDGLSEDGHVISYGLTSYGYDARLSSEFKVVDRNFRGTIDPKNLDPSVFLTFTADRYLELPPNGFVLGRTLERFVMPPDVVAVCYAKSTYARCGIVVGVTPIEPGWEGYVTLEFSNTSSAWARIYVGEGICQFQFHRGEPCTVTYADRDGKYQNQVGVVLPRM